MNNDAISQAISDARNKAESFLAQEFKNLETNLRARLKSSVKITDPLSSHEKIPTAVVRKRPLTPFQNAMVAYRAREHGVNYNTLSKELNKNSRGKHKVQITPNRLSHIATGNCTATAREGAALKAFFPKELAGIHPDQFGQRPGEQTKVLPEVRIQATRKRVKEVVKGLLGGV